MSYFVNRLGKRYGRLVVLKQVTKHAPIKWKCECDCGAIVIKRGSGLASGASQSCGCLHGEKIARARTKHGHAMRHPPEYRAWTHLRQRCDNPNDKDYQHYGGRGITVCPRWRESFNNFLADMGQCPTGHSIDRIDVNGNYEPTNCRWATQKEQTNNMRRNRRLEWRGSTKTISQWADTLGQPAKLISSRVKAGWPTERALTEPVNWYRKPWRANRTAYA